jgi:RHS repeat-associated protein
VAAAAARAGSQQAAPRAATSAGPATVTTYTYNGDGLRATETTAAGTTAFTYDTTTSVPTLLTDGTYSYIYGPDGLPFEQVTNSGTVSFLFHDALGSVRAVVSSSGTVTGTFTYGPFGQLTAETGTGTTPQGYAGGYTDQASGLLYLINRYYDPATAQFVSVDPAVSSTGDPYAYASDNPVNASDPSGLFTLCVVLFCGGYDKGQGVNYGLQSPGLSLTLGNKTYGLPSKDFGGSAVCWTNLNCTFSGGYAGNGPALVEQDGKWTMQLCGGFYVYSTCVDPSEGGNPNAHQIAPPGGSNTFQNIINSQPKNALQSDYAGQLPYYSPRSPLSLQLSYASELSYYAQSNILPAAYQSSYTRGICGF